MALQRGRGTPGLSVIPALGEGPLALPKGVRAELPGPPLLRWGSLALLSLGKAQLFPPQSSENPQPWTRVMDASAAGLLSPPRPTGRAGTGGATRPCLGYSGLMSPPCQAPFARGGPSVTSSLQPLLGQAALSLPPLALGESTGSGDPQGTRGAQDVASPVPPPPCQLPDVQECEARGCPWGRGGRCLSGGGRDGRDLLPPGLSWTPGRGRARAVGRLETATGPPWSWSEGLGLHGRGALAGDFLPSPPGNWPFSSQQAPWPELAALGRGDSRPGGRGPWAPGPFPALAGRWNFEPRRCGPAAVEPKGRKGEICGLGPRMGKSAGRAGPGRPSLSSRSTPVCSPLLPALQRPRWAPLLWPWAAG